jgi:adenine-specific DNA-methyltransferase
MSSLYFKGKSAIWNHHLSVPYHTLEKDNKASLKGENDDENLIIEGDNLLALKALLPKYQGRIKCIYIDPPYNTGNENWVYSDNVNSPLIKDWVGKAVGIDDLTRHDKWLCMMTPRLKLLKELLTEHGVMFISIDDIEVANLKKICDEIFGEENTELMIWDKIANQENAGSGKMKITYRFRKDHEYILVIYKNKAETFFNKPLKIFEYKNEYGNKDNDPRGNWLDTELCKSEEKSIKKGKNYYSIKLPSGNIIERQWHISKEEFDELDKDNRIYWGSGKSLPRKKVFLDEARSSTPISVLKEYGSTTDGIKDLYSLFNADLFENPKPVSLIKHLVRISSEKDSIILDAFAGSGTTAQAILELNKEYSENRKTILIQLPEIIKKDTPAYKAGYRYIHEITKDRVEKVIEKDKLKTGFTYYKLGPSIDADSILAGKLPKYEEFAKYVFYLATGRNHPDDKKIKEKDYFAGKSGGESIYLVYKQDLDSLKKLAITLEWAEETNKKDSGKKIVYAPACFLDDEYLEKFNIQFVSIPYNLFEKK